MFAEAALLVIRAYRDSVLVKFLDGQEARLENLTWSHDEGANFAEVIGNAVAAKTPEAMRFYTNEIACVHDPRSGEAVFRLPVDLAG